MRLIAWAVSRDLVRCFTDLLKGGVFVLHQGLLFWEVMRLIHTDFPCLFFQVTASSGS